MWTYYLPQSKWSQIQSAAYKQEHRSNNKTEQVPLATTKIIHKSLCWVQIKLFISAERKKGSRALLIWIWMNCASDECDYEKLTKTPKNMVS